MNDLHEVLVRLESDLEALRLRWALIGGIAVSAHRAKDLQDIEALLDVAAESDLRRARESLELLSRRGYERNQNLLGRFAELLEGHGR